MNRLLKTSKLFLCLWPVLWAGCKQERYEEATPTLNVRYLAATITNFNSVEADAFSQDFKVIGIGTAWEFSQVPDWMSLSRMQDSGSKDVILQVEPNPSAETSRTALFYLRSLLPGWDYQTPLMVSQGKAEPSLTTEKTSLNFAGYASEQALKVTSNCSFTTICSERWLHATVDEDAGRIMVSVDDNPQNQYRTATLSINYHTKIKTIDITQWPAFVTASDYTLQFDNTASRYNLKLSSELPWTAKVSHGWIQVSPMAGLAGDTTIAIEVSPNTTTETRTGFVAFYAGGVEKLQVTIEQKGIYVELPSTLSLSSFAQKKEIALKSNADWEVKSCPSWLQVAPERGSGNATLTIQCDDNSSTASRKGFIKIGVPGMSETYTTEVVQQGKRLAADVAQLLFSPRAQQGTFALESDGAWSLLVQNNMLQDQPWFTATPTNGTGSATIEVQVKENIGGKARSGSISISAFDKTLKVEVIQQDPFLKVDDPAFDFSSKGGVHQLSVSSNEAWRVEKSADWLQVSPGSGSGSANLTFTIADNSSAKARESDVEIKSDYAPSVRIRVSQRARYLSANRQQVLFFAKGGTETIEVQTDGVCEARCDAVWCSITQEQNRWVLQAQANSSQEMRQGILHLTLTDVKEGRVGLEIPVVQAGIGGTFIKEGYGQDRDWDSFGNGSIRLQVVGYTTDQNWNEAGNGSADFGKTNYGNEQKWD